MAFDLNAFLQENRRFLAGVAVAGAVFIVGTAVIGSVFGAEHLRSRSELQGLTARAAKEPLFTKANLDEAKEQQSKLAACVESLGDRLRFKPRPEFQLKDGGMSPANQYLDIAARMREDRLDDARSRGVDLVDSAGVPDRAPTQIEEIRRTLLGLDLIDRILRHAVAARVRSIERVSLQLPKVRTDRRSVLYREEIRVETEIVAGSRALSSFLEATLGGDAPLTLESLESQSLAGNARWGDGAVRVSATFLLLDPTPPKE